MTYCGGNAGRGAHALSLEAAKKVFEVRTMLAELFDADSPEQVCFTLNTTYALNTCIKGFLRKGDHVLISDMEHNAVFRPIYKLSQMGIIEYDVFPSMLGVPNRNPTRICAGIARRMKKNTRMVVCSGASNICSLTMPISEIGAFCHRHGMLFVVDGAQYAGHAKISVRKMNIDALCIPAHKGLLGPQGCGAFVLGSGVLADTLIEGGNGVASLEGDMPDYSPERYEAGTLPAPAIVGLGEGIRALERVGIDSIAEHERRLCSRAVEALGNIRGVTLHCPEYRGSVLLFNIDKMRSDDASQELSRIGVCVRGGYHCSALGHKTLGTLDGGGIRASFGPFNSSCDVDTLARAVQSIARG